MLAVFLSVLRLGTLNEALQCIKTDVESVEISVQKLSMVMQTLCIDFRLFLFHVLDWESSCTCNGRELRSRFPLVQESFGWV